MPVDIKLVVSQMLAAKNALAKAADGSALYGLGVGIDDERRSIEEAVESAHLGDEDVMLAIYETSRHWARNDYAVLSASITSGNPLPSHVGDIGRPQIQRWSGDAYQPGKKATHDQIVRWRANTGTYPFDVCGALAHSAANSPLAGYFHLTEDERLYYTGLDAKVPLCSYTRIQRTVTDAAITSGTAALTSPALAQFTASDVGRLAVIQGAGANGVVFAAGIRTRNSATSATLDANAGATVSGARMTISALQSPAVYAAAVFARAMARFDKEGDSERTNESWFMQSERMLALVRNNERELPEVVQMPRAA
jgi:hypothetical protein